MHDTSKAEKVYDESGKHIGFVLEIADGIWLPLDLTGRNFSGPSSKLDATHVVKSFHDKPDDQRPN